VSFIGELESQREQQPAQASDGEEDEVVRELFR